MKPTLHADRSERVQNCSEGFACALVSKTPKQHHVTPSMDLRPIHSPGHPARSPRVRFSSESIDDNDVYHHHHHHSRPTYIPTPRPAMDPLGTSEEDSEEDELYLDTDDNDVYHHDQHHSRSTYIPTPRPGMDPLGTLEEDELYLDTDLLDEPREPISESGVETRKERSKPSLGRIVGGLKKFRQALTWKPPSYGRRGAELADSGLRSERPSRSHMLAGTNISSGRAEHLRQPDSRSLENGPGPGANIIHENLRRHEDATEAAGYPIVPADRMPSPIAAELRLSTDYAKMGSPPASVREVPLSAYIFRLRQFLKDVYKLPWIAPRPTVDFYPRQSGSHAPPETLSPPNWYAFLHRQSIDLLSSGSPSPPVSSPDDWTNLADELEAPIGDNEHPASTFPPSYYPVYGGYNFPRYMNTGPIGYGPSNPVDIYGPPMPSQMVYIETAPSRYIPLNGVQIYGPPVSSHAGRQYPYPIPWPSAPHAT